MKIYLVGGAVRDELLQQPVQEWDWVVVGASAEQLLAQGYKAVGKDFPVFIHPKTGDEYALARTECKTAPGYKGFEFDASSSVSLEDDLRRRDLTINAMARDDEGNIIDPYGGCVDLAAGILRHVSPAFIEDPVRVLRIARFAARFAHLGFTVAEETLELMRQMASSGELDHLVPERVWQEFEKVLSERHPSSFFATLADCGALKKIFPEISAVFNKENMQTLQKSVLLSNDTQVHFAAIMQFLHHDLVLARCQHFRIPKAYTRLAILTAQYREAYQHCQQLTVDELLNLFNALNVWHSPQLLQQFILACQSNVLLHDSENISAFLRGLYQAVHRAGDTQALLEQGLSGEALGQALDQQRKQTIEAALSTLSN